MKATDTVMLITGGGSGIRRGLAEAFHQAGNRVIIAGRREAALEETVRAHPGMVGRVLELDNLADIESSTRIQNEFSNLNVLINSAGIMPPEDVKTGVRNLPAVGARPYRRTFSACCGSRQRYCPP